MILYHIEYSYISKSRLFETTTMALMLQQFNNLPKSYLFLLETNFGTLKNRPTPVPKKNRGPYRRKREADWARSCLEEMLGVSMVSQVALEIGRATFTKESSPYQKRYLETEIHWLAFLFLAWCFFFSSEFSGESVVFVAKNDLGAGLVGWGHMKKIGTQPSKLSTQW